MNHLTTHKHRESSYLRAYKAHVNRPRSSTAVENALQISSFMQNKANLPGGEIDAKCVFIKDYEEKCG